MRVRAVAISLLVLLLAEFAVAGLGSGSAMYVGGTVSAIKEKTEGKLILTDADAVTFQFKSGKHSIPYAQVNSLEYGQKAGRRLGLAIVVNPLFLLSKKRKHYFTIGYLDSAQKQQAAVFELVKHAIHQTITALEAKTGKKVDYEDDEARKSGAGKN